MPHFSRYLLPAHHEDTPEPDLCEHLEIVRAVVVGNLWGRNFGDDLMLLGLFAHLPRSEVRILCQHNAEALRELGVVAEPLSIARYWRSIRRAHRVVVPGGTHLQFVAEMPSATQYRLLASWLVLAVLARVTGARPEMEAVGVGPLETTLSRLLARWTCRLQGSITSRDRVSRELLSAWGMSAPLVDDLALPFLRKWRTEHPTASCSDEDPYLVAAPAYARYDAQWWVDRIGELMTATGVRRLVFFASGRQSGGDDLVAISAITRRLNAVDIQVDQTHAYEGETDAALRFIDGAVAVIAARYHVVLAARALGKHVVADIYHPKVLDAIKVEPIG